MALCRAGKAYLGKPKAASEMNDAEVLAKAKAAAEWCAHATTHEEQYGGLPAAQGGDAAQAGKPWMYLLIPHDVITDNKTLQGLAATYTYGSASSVKQ